MVDEIEVAEEGSGSRAHVSMPKADALRRRAVRRGLQSYEVMRRRDSSGDANEVDGEDAGAKEKNEKDREDGKDKEKVRESGGEQ